MEKADRFLAPRPADRPLSPGEILDRWIRFGTTKHYPSGSAT